MFGLQQKTKTNKRKYTRSTVADRIESQGFRWSRALVEKDPDLKRAAVLKFLGVSEPNPAERAGQEVAAAIERAKAQAILADPNLGRQLVQAEIVAKMRGGGSGGRGGDLGPYSDLNSALDLIDRINGRDGDRDEDDRGHSGGLSGVVAQVFEAAAPLVRAAMAGLADRQQQMAAYGPSPEAMIQPANGPLIGGPPVPLQPPPDPRPPLADAGGEVEEPVLTSPNGTPIYDADEPLSAARLTALCNLPPEQAALYFWNAVSAHLAGQPADREQIASAMQLLCSDWTNQTVLSMLKPAVQKDARFRPVVAHLEAHPEWTQVFRAALRAYWEHATSAAAQNGHQLQEVGANA